MLDWKLYNFLWIVYEGKPNMDKVLELALINIQRSAKNIFAINKVKNNSPSSHPTLSPHSLLRTQYLPNQRIHHLLLDRVNLNALLLDWLRPLCYLLHAYAHWVCLKVAISHHVLLVAVDWLEESGWLGKVG
jgi:hypothetical protein